MVARPSSMFAIMDGVSTGSWDFNADPTTPSEYPGRIHNGGADVLFVDGHVSWRPQRELVVLEPGQEPGDGKAQEPSQWTTESRDVARHWNNHGHWHPNGSG